LLPIHGQSSRKRSRGESYNLGGTLVALTIELLRKLGEGLFAANRGKGHLRFESRTVIPARSSGHGSSPVLGKIADLQAKISPNHIVQISRATSMFLHGAVRYLPKPDGASGEAD
jgi:hypothetical protein